MSTLRRVLVLVVVLATSAAQARSGAVATEHPLAAAAGATMLREGGTAVDAAIAAAAAICVVHPTSCGIGGGHFAIVHTADGRDAALDAREVAPAAATLDRYLRDGVPDPTRTRNGGLAVAVPAEVAGWIALHTRFGRLPLATVLAPAIRLARDGVPLSETPFLREQIAKSSKPLAADPGLAAVFLRNGSPPTADDRIVQRDLAATLERIGRHGLDGFLASADAIARTVQERGGVLTARDVRTYRPRWLEPLTGSFHGRRVITFPVPGSGAIVLTTLGILEHDDLAHAEPGARAHLLAGALGQGLADRAAWYGDVPVPVRSLLDPGRLRALRDRIPSDRVASPTTDVVADAGTANVAVVDGDGNAVAITTTINTTFGSGIMVPGTGIVLNDEMDDFALPGVANTYGLTGGDANGIVPGKRPQSSMSPTIVLDGNRPILAVGASGGPLIISSVVQTILGVVVDGKDLREAVAAPRLHDPGRPPKLAVEPTFPASTRATLTKIGHEIVEIPAIAAVSAAGLDESGKPTAAGDRRKDGGEAVVR